MSTPIGSRVPVSGMAALACLLAIALPAAAATSVTTPQGAVVTIWEDHPVTYSGDPGAGRWAIAYSVRDDSGTRSGTIAPTGDADRDSSPLLLLDQVSGSPVALWSRFDGAFLKIAYARFEGGTFSDFHYLTFGRGDDTLPRIGTGLTGSYLFWVSDGRRYMYAPIDLAGGWLLASPKQLPYGAVRSESFPLERLSESDSTGARGQGGASGSSKTGVSGGRTTSRTPIDPTELSSQGGIDSPGIINHNGGAKGGGPGKAEIWDVGGQPDCSTLVLVVPDRSLRALYVVKFSNGAFEVLRQIQVPTPLPARFGESVAQAYLASVCQ
jgi:hypothetical protein